MVWEIFLQVIQRSSLKDICLWRSSCNRTKFAFAAVCGYKKASSQLRGGTIPRVYPHNFQAIGANQGNHPVCMSTVVGGIKCGNRSEVLPVHRSWRKCIFQFQLYHLQRRGGAGTLSPSHIRVWGSGVVFGFFFSLFAYLQHMIYALF